MGKWVNTLIFINIAPSFQYSVYLAITKLPHSCFICTSLSFRSGPISLASHCGALSHFRSIHFRICGGPFKALERAGSRLGGEAPPRHVSSVPWGGARASKLPSLPALCQSRTSEGES